MNEDWESDPEKLELYRKALSAAINEISSIDSNIADRVIMHRAATMALLVLMPYVELPSTDPPRRTWREVLGRFLAPQRNGS